MVSRETISKGNQLTPLTLALLFLRSLAFSLGMISCTVLIAPVVICCFALPFHGRYTIAKWWSRFNIWWLKFTCNVNYQISGQENLPETPVIIMAKHQSTWETLFLQMFLPPLSWVVKRELLWVPLFGWALALLWPIAIDRKSSTVAVKQILKQGKNHLDHGTWVLIFPEGTRTAPGQRKRYGLGGSRLAVHTGYPVLPIAHNAGVYWPRRGFLKYPGTIQLRIGPVISSQGKEVQALNTEIENWIEDAVRELNPVGPVDLPDSKSPASP